MKALYQEYIREMSSTWSESSVRSESQRLNRLLDSIDGDPAKLWGALKEYGPYSRSTYWTRVVAFFDWAIELGKISAPNPYRLFRKKNKKCFSNTYVRKPCEVEYQDAKDRIAKIDDEDLRNKALQLLGGGLRWSESFTLTEDGYVTGKGGRVRRVYAPRVPGAMATKERYSAMLRALRKVGLRPHKLRSIKMTAMVDKGANPFELKKFAGWSSLSTAESYVNAKDDRIRAMATEDEVS